MPKLKNSNATFWVIFKHCVFVLSFFYSFGSVERFLQRYKHLNFLFKKGPFSVLHSHKKGRCLNYFYRGLEQQYYYYGTKADSVLVGQQAVTTVGGGLKPRDNFIQNIIITLLLHMNCKLVLGSAAVGSSSCITQQQQSSLSPSCSSTSCTEADLHCGNFLGFLASVTRLSRICIHCCYH